ncbi:MAG: hypothetical protein ACON4B_00760 [Flavobacteriaceae bacterium]
MKLLIWVLFIGSFTSILIGLLFDLKYSQKFIGSGVVGLFLVVFPLFSYFRWKDKKVSDYMLTKENLDKMRDLNEKKS